MWKAVCVEPDFEEGRNSCTTYLALISENLLKFRITQSRATHTVVGQDFKDLAILRRLYHFFHRPSRYPLVERLEVRTDLKS